MYIDHCHITWIYVVGGSGWHETGARARGNVYTLPCDFVAAPLNIKCDYTCMYISHSSVKVIQLNELIINLVSRVNAEAIGLVWPNFSALHIFIRIKAMYKEQCKPIDL
jgi:hypothetical protein